MVAQATEEMRRLGILDDVILNTTNTNSNMNHIYIVMGFRLSYKSSIIFLIVGDATNAYMTKKSIRL